MSANKNLLKRKMNTIYKNYYELTDGYVDEEFLASAIRSNLQSKDGVEWELDLCDKALSKMEDNKVVRSKFYIEFIKLRNDLQQLLKEYNEGKRKSRTVRE